MKRVAALASMPKEKKDPSFRKFIQRLVARKPKNLDNFSKLTRRFLQKRIA
jgi:predicted CopG family antitoxin